MTYDLTDARNRLVSPRQLHQVAALLNMPHLDMSATHNDDAPQTRQQAALYAGIADWARLSAQAAEQLGKPNAPETTDQFAYLIEYTDQHAKGWHQAPSEHSHGITPADTAETVAETVLTRYITHLAQHRDNYQLWLVDSLSLRASVWHVDTAEAHPRGRRPNCPSSAHTFNEAGILPHAVEIRTPIQIHRFMDHRIAP
ncbi:hypothetical protein [Nonomuraea jiangxiensis]|uniref:Uncharacterized protein n=1 Tax=Nonomuraea jiangxiensis TaxID=633440 RepID=A0A1G9LLP3_9ACTN|nr:hypothetical protein [Nonomuraea jiangxiensis]SDL62744.1 hypothetical protein SAMN05421869_12847 [Nonomuraea jiangxiensis]